MCERGGLGPKRLIDLIADLCRKLEAAQKRIEELEKELGRRPTAKLDEPFSMRAEEKRQEARGKKRRGDKPEGPKRPPSNG